MPLNNFCSILHFPYLFSFLTFSFLLSKFPPFLDGCVSPLLEISTPIAVIFLFPSTQQQQQQQQGRKKKVRVKLLGPKPFRAAPYVERTAKQTRNRPASLQPVCRNTLRSKGSRRSIAKRLSTRLVKIDGRRCP